MLQLRIDDSGLARDEINGISKTLLSYVEHLQVVAQDGGYSFPESSINLPADLALLEQVRQVTASKRTSALRYILDIGIGGSNLGTKALYDAVWGSFDLLQPDRYPKIIFADTTDPEFLAHLVRFLEEQVREPGEVLVNAISKSGTTTETVVNLEVVLAALQRRFPKALEQLVVTTDFQSKLWRVAESKGITRLSIPDKVGGRYSVFSSVGLFPLDLAGVDVESCCSGALEMRERCLSRSLGENPALLSAVVLFLEWKRGRIINDNFFFHPELESCGKWYRQLMGESIGKERDLQGRPVHCGITPTVSIGSTDLHSMAQLYLGGPPDKLTTFFWSERNLLDTDVASEPTLPGLVAGIAGKSVSSVMRAILEGTKAAFRKEEIPFMEVVLPDLTARSLGEMLQFKMIEMMLLANLLEVNAFDQPSVESYKVETRRILEGD